MYSEFSNTNKEFNRQELDDELVFYTYLEYFPKTNKSYFSPFITEKTPSFRFYINKDLNLRFKCFASGYGGDCIELVCKMYGISGGEALEKIKTDLGFNGETEVSKKYTVDFLEKIKRIDKTETTPAMIEVQIRDLSLEDLIYWGQFGLNEKDLDEWDVKACRQVWLNNKIWYDFRKVDPCYRYRISDRYKIYRPFRVGKGKWMTNVSEKGIQGFRFLPEKGELLVITKSYKDIMVLKKHLSINSISLNSESAILSKEMVNYLYSRFDNIIILYDNDSAGIKNAEKISKDTDIPFVYIPSEYGSKDPAELYKNKGKEIFTRVVKQLLTI